MKEVDPHREVNPYPSRPGCYRAADSLGDRVGLPRRWMAVEGCWLVEVIRPLVVASGADVPVLPAQVFDPARLTAVAATELMDTGPDESLDDLAVLAASLTGARRAFSTLVDARRSFWVSAVEVSDRRPTI
jgi:hypothetical protein